MYDRVSDFLGNAQSADVLVRRARRMHAEGKTIPGFDHPLYPKGDPRAAQMLAVARRRAQPSRHLNAVIGFMDEMQSSTGLLPRQELAVVMLTRAMGLGRQAPAALFVLGRLAGWVAHVQEQRAAGTLLRPRARFVEPAPG